MNNFYYYLFIFSIVLISLWMLNLCKFFRFLKADNDSSIDLESLAFYYPVRHTQETFEVLRFPLFYVKSFESLFIVYYLELSTLQYLFSGPYFPDFGLNTEIYRVNLHTQSEYRIIRAKKNYVFGHFSRSETCTKTSRCLKVNDN